MTRIIGIAGGSGSGKTTLARALAQALAPSARIIAEDDYYRCSTTVAGFDAAVHDFDALEAKDMARLAADLRALRGGGAIEKPLYDYVTHTRRAETETVHPADHVIVEGILALADPDVRAAYDLAVWLDTPGDLRLLRRVRRDVAERGRSVDSVLDQYQRTVRPAHLRHAAAQAQGAHLILDAEAICHDLDAMVAQILAALRR
ncbi:MAG: uridine kinase [Hyphomonadaceae bacterium]|nr:uridine kinase [Hyphomonadaceae bacterium]